MNSLSGDSFFDSWPDNMSQMFRWNRDLVPPEYIVFVRSGRDLFSVKRDWSTHDFPDLDLNQFKSLYESKELVYAGGLMGPDDARYRKTGGCICGGWAIRGFTPEMHWEDCPGRKILPKGFEGW